MAHRDWPSPWQPLLFLSCFLCVSMATTAFPSDLEPISVVSWEHSFQFPSFQGLLQDNDTLRLGLDFQTMIRINHMLYIAARDHVFAVNLTTAAGSFVPQMNLTWKSKDVGKCTVRGKNSDECYNYVKVLVPRNDETLFACGTNAFNPTCRNYKMGSLLQVGEDLGGQARCPFESGQSSVGLFAGGDFYSATTTDFLASDAVIYRSLGEERPVLRTVKYDSKWLREPHFLHAVDFGNYIYFFFREISVEYTALGKVVFSRVGRVCKNDNGGSPRVLDRYWTSFLKARLNCSVPGDSFFYFDVLQSLTNILQINSRPAVVGVFTTQANSIPGSGVCAFFMDDIEKVFNGKFKEQKTTDSSWTSVPDHQVPKPRPGTCAGDGLMEDYTSSVQFPDETLMFIKSFPLIDDSVASVHHRPLFTRTSRSKLSQIAADISAGAHRDRTVLFLGSDDGKLLKLLVNPGNHSFSSVLLEEVQVYNPLRCNVQGQEDRRVLGLELDRENHAVFVAFSSCVIRVPLSRCSQHRACRRSCLASRDPYCIWLRTGSCTNMAPGFKAGFEQDLDGDHSFSTETCHGDIMATSRNHDSAADSAYGLDADSDPASAHVHYTLLIACVLVAFSLGAILSGFMVSCYCRGPAHLATPLAKDPEASLPRALSLRSLAKLNGLLDHSSKEKLDVSRLYSSFVNGGSEPHLNSPVHLDRPLGGAAELSLSQTLSQADGEFESSLPTPDSTPELPNKNTNKNSNNAKDTSCSGSATSCPSKPGHASGFMAIVGNTSVFSQHQATKSDSVLSNGAIGTAQFTEDNRKTASEERGSGVGGTYHHQSQQSLPQSVVDVSALDELLRHIHEVSASGTGGIKVLTSTSSSSLFPNHHHLHHHQPHHSPTTRMHHYNQQQQLQSKRKPPETDSYSGLKLLEPPQSSSKSSQSSLRKIPEQNSGGGGESAVAVNRSHSQRQLIKMGAVPRHHSFNQRGSSFLARMNTNSSCNGPPQIGANNTKSANAGKPHVSLTRQHSYSEGPTTQKAGVRRSVSLKPQVPPKPLFLPNTATLAEGTEKDEK